MFRTLVYAVIVLTSALAVAQEDLGKELLQWEASPCASPQCNYLSLQEYENVLEVIFGPQSGDPQLWQSQYGSVILRRDPSFGYPREVVILMGQKPRAFAFEIANPIVIPDHPVMFMEHLHLIASKFHTRDAEELAKHITVKRTELDASIFEPLLSEIEHLPLAPSFNRSDAVTMVGDGTIYSLEVSTPESTLRFTSNTASRGTAAQQKLRRVFEDVWRRVFPTTDFESSRQ